MWIITVCGVVHVASSVAIGAVGAVAGQTFDLMNGIESARGELAAGLLLGLEFMPTRRLARYADVVAGLVVAASGAVVLFLEI